MHPHKTIFAATLISLFSLAPFAHAQSFKIANDTFLDSGSPGSPDPANPSQTNGGPGTIVNGQDIYSYGADTKVKAVASSYSSSYPFVSYTHVLFNLNTPSSPAQPNFWTTLNSDIAAYPSLLTNPNFKVTVNYYPVNDSLLAGNDAHTNLELHPLTHSFTVGNGLQNKAPVQPVPSTTGGAAWTTYDGSVADAWSTPGGDYDSANFVNFSNSSPLPASNGSTPFSWNIAPLIANPAARAELQNFGALIKVNNETQFPPVDSNGTGAVNDFVSFNSANNPSTSPFVPTLVISLPGDANSDGLVNADDYTIIDRGFANHLTGFSNGDLNSDGTIDQKDYFIIDTFLGQTQGLSPALLAQRTIDFGPAYVTQLLAAIPEPTSLTLLALSALPLLTRRQSPTRK